MRFLAIAVLVLCHVGCLNSESCLRHSDCDGDDVCVGGRCQPESATVASTVGAGGTSGAAGTSAGAAGAAGSGGAGGG